MTLDATRRRFLRTASTLGALGTAAPFAMNLAAIGAASAQTAADYKALVCVFLYGGNDCANTVIPYDPAAYATYRSARPEIARTRESLVALRTRPAKRHSPCRRSLPRWRSDTTTVRWPSLATSAHWSRR